MPKQEAGDHVNRAEGEQSGATQDAASKAATPDEQEQAATDETEACQTTDEEPGNGAGGDGDSDDEESLEALRETVTALEQGLVEAKDQVLRARAEEENTRRRAARDADNARKFALTKFAGELLPVIDNFERALEAAADDSAVYEGLDLSMKLLSGVLGKAGIEVVDPIGEPFDPAYHEAMATVDNPDAEPGSVMEVVQKGYVLNGRLLRAAMVLVAKRSEDHTQG